jgi:hypothetical protein
VRLLIDSLLAVLLLSVLASVMWFQQSRRHQRAQVAAVQAAVQIMEREALYRAAVGEAERTARGYAMRIDETWFDRKPVNLLSPRIGPWLEIATSDEADATHPACILAGAHGLADFWYNPYRGIVRARVPMQVSQDATVELYHRVNRAMPIVGNLVWDPTELTRRDDEPLNELFDSFLDDESSPETDDNSSTTKAAVQPDDPILRDLGVGR